MAATWILRKRNSGLVIWQGPGGEAPGIVVDNKVYHDVFSRSFPDNKIAWGPGDFEMMLVSDGATHQVGPVTDYSIVLSDGSVRTNIAGVTSTSPDKGATNRDGEGSARIITDHQREAHDLLGSTGLPKGVILDDGLPKVAHKGFRDVVEGPAGFEDVKPPVEAPVASGPVSQASSDPSPVKATTPVEAPDFTLLLKNVRQTILTRRNDWALRIASIPEFVWDHHEKNPGGINLVLDGLLLGRMFHGMVDDGMRYQLPTETFLLDDCSPKTRLYIRWMLNYQEIESQVADHLADRQDMDAERCFALCLEMFHDATELYLREKGWDPETEPATKMGHIYPTVMAELRARASFVASKDAEYGQPIRRHGIYGVITRVFDKIARFTTLKSGAIPAPKFESALDSLKDLGGYSLILAGMFQEAVEITGDRV